MAVSEGCALHDDRGRQARLREEGAERRARVVRHARLAEAGAAGAGRAVRTRRDGRVPHRVRACGPAATRSIGRRDRVDLCDAASLPSGRCPTPMRRPGSSAWRALVAAVARRRGLPVPDVTRRLATLERQVEEALAGSGQPATLVPPLESLVDGFVDGYSRLRRAVAGEREATTELLSAPLDLLYRWWWRVDVDRPRAPARAAARSSSSRTARGALLPYEAFMLARALGAAGIAAPARWSTTGCSACRSSGGRRGARRRAAATADCAAPRPRRRRGGDRLPRGHGRRGQAARHGATGWRRSDAPALLRVAAEARRADRPGRPSSAPRRCSPCCGGASGSAACSVCRRVPVHARRSCRCRPSGRSTSASRSTPRRTAPTGALMRAVQRCGVRERLQGLVSDGVDRRRGLFV